MNTQLREMLVNDFKIPFFDGVASGREILITPETAKIFLSSSTGNRKIKQRHLQHLADFVEAGNLLTTGNSIGFDKDFNLCDGHHRVIAISKGTKPAKQLVTINLDRASNKYADKNAKRTTSDAISMYSAHDFDFPVTRNITAIAQFIAKVAGIESSNISDNTCEKILISNEKGIGFIVDNYINQERSICNAAVKSAIASAYYFVNEEKLTQFCRILSKGAIESSSASSNAALVCREFLTTGKLLSSLSKYGASSNTGGGDIYGKAIFNFVQFCIKKFVTGQNVSRGYTGIKTESDKVIWSDFIYPPKTL